MFFVGRTFIFSSLTASTPERLLPEKKKKKSLCCILCILYNIVDFFLFFLETFFAKTGCQAVRRLIGAVQPTLFSPASFFGGVVTEYTPSKKAADLARTGVASYLSCSMSKPPPRTAALSLSMHADVPEPVLDAEREERLRRIMVLWGGGASESTVIRVVTREFSVTPGQVTKDLADLREHLRQRLDDEGVIDAVMFTSAARANSIVEEFHGLSLRPIPDRIVEVPSPDPTQPDLAVYREPTPAEVATLMNAKAAAARAAISAMEFQTKLLGKRSPKWAEKPAQVVQVSVGKDGLTAEERELLRALGMGT